MSDITYFLDIISHHGIVHIRNILYNFAPFLCITSYYFTVLTL